MLNQVGMYMTVCLVVEMNDFDPFFYNVCPTHSYI